jgi:RNA polymerase sigma factor (sigma-70 family)
MPLLTEDRELLRAFRDGEAEALDRVYRHYAPRVSRILARGFVYLSGGTPVLRAGLSSAFELEGAVQEVFARAFEERARLSYDGLRPYVDFLVGIGKHVVLQEARRRGSREALGELDDAASAAVAEEAPPPEERLASEQAQQAVRAFLEESCDDRDRKLFQLRFNDDLGQEAAGQALGLTRIQVRRWETKFRTRLLRHLKRVGYVG